MTGRPAPATERFWVKVDKSAGCWLFQGADNGYGYGYFRGAEGKAILAHRFSWQELVGPIPAGLTLDHLCRVRRCVNPAHLEPVTNRENILRGTAPTAINATKSHCPLGHPYSGTNLRTRKTGGRYCAACNVLNVRAVRARRKARLAEAAS